MRLIDLLDIKCRSISSMSIWKLTNLVSKDSELLEAILGEESDDSDFEVECIESLLSLFNRAFSFLLTLRWQPRQNEKTEFLIELTNLEECSLLTLTLLDKIHDWQFTFLDISTLINILELITPSISLWKADATPGRILAFFRRESKKWYRHD